MCPQFSGIENELASEAARDFLLEPKEGAHAQDALLIYDLNNKRLSRKTEYSTTPPTTGRGRKKQFSRNEEEKLKTVYYNY